MKYFSSQNLLATVLSLLVLASCSPSENTVVIEDAPVSSSSDDTTQQQDTEPMGPFKQLTIGENQVIPSLDPLFVSNDGGMRALQLLYEGLVQYDTNGEITPAIANEWSVSNEDKTYRFNLKSDLFYHDNTIFANGRGRRLVAADVKKVFERMAQTNVPDHAAQLFMNIKGFEPYFSEQHQVMIESERQLSGVRGIRAPDDTTIVFSLVEPDEQFLNKLASPYALIYPQESVKASSFKSVGTGPFTLSQQAADSMYIFSRFDNYRMPNQPKINRVDIVTSSNEAALLNAMSRGEIQLIPELGPQQLAMVLNNSGNLKTSLESDYALHSNRGTSAYYLRYNTNADISKAAASSALATVNNQSIFSDLPGNRVQITWAVQAGSTSADSLSGTYSDNTYVRSFYTQLSNQLAANGITFEMNSTRVRNRNIPLYVDSHLNVTMRTTPPNTLVTITVQPLAITSSDVKNLQFNQLPWWIDLRNVTLPSTNSR